MHEVSCFFLLEAVNTWLNTLLVAKFDKSVAERVIFRSIEVSNKKKNISRGLSS